MFSGSLRKIKQRANERRYRLRHPDRVKARSVKWYEKNSEYAKAVSRSKSIAKFGMTWEQYNSLLAFQNNVCALCAGSQLEGKRYAIDHDHVTGHNRGLLCDQCNLALGKFKDNAAVLRKAADYVERFQRTVIR